MMFYIPKRWTKAGKAVFKRIIATSVYCDLNSNYWVLPSKRK